MFSTILLTFSLPMLVVVSISTFAFWFFLSLVVQRSINKWLLFFGIFLFSGCATAAKVPDLGELYNQPAQYHHLERNPVILIPGITGSKLVDKKTGQIVWGAFGAGAANPRTEQGARLIALPMEEGVSLKDLRDDVVPKGVLDRLKVRVFGLSVTLNAYVNILRSLGVVGKYRDEDLAKAMGIDYGRNHYTCFQFDYDWRRDIIENARRLDEFIKTKRAYVQRKLEEEFGVKDYDVKFDVVAHSMGGLLARYYLEYGANPLPEDGALPPVNWDGAGHIEKLIMVGTPNSGSMEAFLNLVQGVKLSSLLPKYEPAVLGTMPSLYELLPRPRQNRVVDAAHPDSPGLDLLDPKLWEEMKWGLVSKKQEGMLKKLLPEVPDQEKRHRIAYDHLRKSLQRAAQFWEAMDQPATPPAGVSFYLFAGDAEPTEAVAAVDRKTGQVSIIKKEAGDGIVLRSSTLGDERVGQPWSPGLVSPVRWTTVHFLFTNHLGLTQSPEFTDNLLFLLLEKGRKDISDVDPTH